MVRRPDAQDIESREPPIVDVPCTAGQPRNYHAWRKEPVFSFLLSSFIFLPLDMATNAPSNGKSVQQSQETAHTQLHDIMSNDASKGAIVHSFDPDVSPQQKAAAAGRQRDQLKSITRQDGSAQGEKELSIDANGGGTVPTITVEDADKATDEEQKKSGGATPSLPATPTMRLQRLVPAGVPVLTFNGNSLRPSTKPLFG
ncbi:hypothetical protein EDB19DRAFT_716905 [Suillus lakei]|nr:hypothetical protein EDB19DRAFT_716905 [Suillus lakei]